MDPDTASSRSRMHELVPTAADHCEDVVRCVVWPGLATSPRTLQARVGKFRVVAREHGCGFDSRRVNIPRSHPFYRHGTIHLAHLPR